jgi:hypothetical protein
MIQSKQKLILSSFLILVSLQGVNAHAAKKPAVKTAPEAAVETPVAEAPAVPSPTPAVEATPSPEAKEAAAAPAPKSEEKSNLYGKKNRNFGNFVVGPYITAVTLPRPFSFGAEAKWLDLFGASTSYGFLPQLKISSVTVKLTGYDVKFKFYPFRGAFFLGVGMGSQTFTGSMTQTMTVATVPTSITATVAQKNSFIAPEMGWNWTWDSGFFFGMELGVQLSSSHATTVTTNADPLVQLTPDYIALQKNITDKADLFAKLPLPLLTLIKIGYFF